MAARPTQREAIAACLLFVRVKVRGKVLSTIGISAQSIVQVNQQANTEMINSTFIIQSSREPTTFPSMPAVEGLLP